MALLSVIIPVYKNTKTQLQRCLQSITDQQFQDFEVLIVDDGNEDDYAKALEQWCEAYAKTKVLHLDHGGVAKARNRALQFADGEYITYIDADDVVTRTFFSDAIKYLVEYKLDVIYGFTKCIDENEILSFYDTCFKNENFAFLSSKNDLYNYFMYARKGCFNETYGYINRGPAGKVLKKTLAFQHLFPDELKIAEDNVWNYLVLQDAKKIGWTSSLWYAYILNKDSATHRFSRNRKMIFSDAMTSLLSFVNDESMSVSYMLRTFEELRGMVNNYYTHPQNHDSILFKIKDFYKFANTFPWNAAMKWKFAKVAGKKGIIKYLLLKARLLYFVCWIMKDK